MAKEKQTYPARFGGLDMGKAFAGRSAPGEAPETNGSASRASISDTARGEIGNREAEEKQLRRHEELWKRERNKIAASSYPYPENDLGSRGHRSIQKDYDERRFVWEQKRDEIENSFAAEREDIRQHGTTLSDEFPVKQAPGLTIAGAPNTDAATPSRSAESANCLGDEFRVHAPALIQGRNR